MHLTDSRDTVLFGSVNRTAVYGVQFRINTDQFVCVGISASISKVNISIINKSKCKMGEYKLEEPSPILWQCIPNIFKFKAASKLSGNTMLQQSTQHRHAVIHLSPHRHNGHHTSTPHNGCHTSLFTLEHGIPADY